MSFYADPRFRFVSCIMEANHERREGIMGREEKRQRARVVKHLRKKLGHEPTEEEIDKALDALLETKRKQTGRDVGH
jgi:hypothetical protein